MSPENQSVSLDIPPTSPAGRVKSKIASARLKVLLCCWHTSFKPPQTTIRQTVLALSLTLAGGLANTLPDDREQAINLSSNRASYENNQGIYTGNVNMSQGSLKIQADKLIIVESQRRVEKVIAHGRPARFEQQPRPNEGAVVASANTIEYKLHEEEILLQDNATITHQGSKISGDRVVYSGKKQTVVADGGNATEAGRVRMTLQPQNKDEAEQKDSATKETDLSAPETEGAAP